MKWILWMVLALGTLGALGTHDSADPYGMVDHCPDCMKVVVDDGSPF